MEEKLQSGVFVVYSHLNRIFRLTIFLIFVSGGGGGWQILHLAIFLEGEGGND